MIIRQPSGELEFQKIMIRNTFVVKEIQLNTMVNVVQVLNHELATQRVQFKSQPIG